MYVDYYEEANTVFYSKNSKTMPFSAIKKIIQLRFKSFI